MSYTSRSELRSGTSVKQVREVIDLLGYVRLDPGFRVPNMVANYHWFDAQDYRSWSGVELQIYDEEGQIAVETRSTISRSYWDLDHQNRTIKLIRDLFGGTFETDAGKSRYLRPTGKPPLPISSGCYLSRWRFENALGKAMIYRQSRDLRGSIAVNKPTGIPTLDEINPRLLSNNLLIPFVIAVWEEFFRSTFAVILKYSMERERVLKKASLSHSQLEQIAGNQRPLEQAIAECFSFQRPSKIAANFLLLNGRLDLGAAMKFPYRKRKLNLYQSIENLVEYRNAFVHSGETNPALYDDQLQQILTDISEAVDRCYRAIASHYKFEALG